MLSKSKSKRIYQFKYLLLVPLVLGMLVYTSCEQEIKEGIPSSETTLSLDDAALIAKINAEYEVIKDNKTFFDEHSKLMNKDRESNVILSKEEFFKNRLFFRKIFEESYELEFSDENFTEEMLSLFSMPSTANYNAYVTRKEVFQVLDNNLKASLNRMNYAVRLVNKEDKDLGSGELVEIGNVKDLTGEEISKVNQVLERIKGTERFLFLRDNTYSFLVSSIKNEKIRKEKPKTIDALTVAFSIVDQVPVFPGCENATDKKACFQESIQRHIRKNFNYPLEAQESGIQGRVSIVFKISKEGAIKNIRMRGPHKLLENEALRIIKRLPQMTPGKHDGKAVDVPFSIPITFKLQDNKTHEDNELQLDIAVSMLDIVNNQQKYDVLPSNLRLKNSVIKTTIEKYNSLVVERNRLLRVSNSSNPIIKNLDEELYMLKLRIQEELKIEISKIERLLKK